jgi:ATP-dependent protease ClpP protease subunit
MIINLTGPVNDRMVNTLIDGLNNMEDSTHYVYLKTDGGDVTCEEMIIHLLSENAKRCILIGYGHLYSAGFTIFFKSECPKGLLPNTTGMIHFASQHIRLTEAGKPATYDPDTFFLKNLKIMKSDSIKFFKSLPFTEKEFTDFTEGKEVWLSYKRMKELFKEHGTEVK